MATLHILYMPPILQDIWNVCNQAFINPYIIAIDASLGRKDHVGLITLGTGPLRPGLGVNKKAA